MFLSFFLEFLTNSLNLVEKEKENE
jgi:hypothetical protein